MNAYIVYALAEAGYDNIKKEFETSFKKAITSKDPVSDGIPVVGSDKLYIARRKNATKKRPAHFIKDRIGNVEWHPAPASRPAKCVPFSPL